MSFDNHNTRHVNGNISEIIAQMPIFDVECLAHFIININILLSANSIRICFFVKCFSFRNFEAERVAFFVLKEDCRSISKYTPKWYFRCI